MRRTPLLVLALLVLAATPARAQDAQYWTQQYGNQARLLGGSVIGSAADVSAVFYNPGRLALMQSPELLLAGNVFEFSRLTLVDALADDRDLSFSRSGSVPSLFAGVIGSLSGDRHRVAYSFLTRYFAELRLDQRASELIPGDPSRTAFVEIGLDRRMSEYWAGLSWAWTPAEGVGVGATGFLTVRNQRSRSLGLIQATSPDAFAVALQQTDFDYSHWGALVKLGAGVDRGPWTIGLTFTTPLLRILGSGSVGYDETLIAHTSTGGPAPGERLISGFQDGLPSRYESPLSVGAGLSRRWGATRVHLGAEWFASVDPYAVLDSEPFAAVLGDESRIFRPRDGRRSVTNLAVGVEHAFSDAVRGYASYRTDDSYARDSVEDGIYAASWDIRHFAAGAQVDYRRSAFTLGVIYAYGEDTLDQALRLDDAAGTTPPLQVRYLRLTGVVGFSIGF